MSISRKPYLVRSLSKREMAQIVRARRSEIGNWVRLGTIEAEDLVESQIKWAINLAFAQAARKAGKP